MNVGVAEQRRETTATFRRVEEIEEIAAEVVECAPACARRLTELAEDLLRSARPVRLADAARLLGLSTPSVRAWCRRGVLLPGEQQRGAPVQTLDPVRLHEVLHVVRELRSLAKEPGALVEQVWQRLEDRELLNREDLRAGLAAWRDGDVVDA